MAGSRVRYLNQREKQATRFMYEDIFKEDSQEFVDYYYDWKLRDNEILIMEDDGDVTCGYQVMLHLNPYDLCINGAGRRIPYVVAVATRPDCRRQGKMQQVMEYALLDLNKNQVPFTFLLPANPAYYQSQGFAYFPGNSPAKREHFQVQNQTLMLVCRKVADKDIPKLAEVSNDILQDRYQIFIRRNEHYYRRQLAEVSAEHGDILIFEAENKIQGLAVYGKGNGTAELKELLVQAEFEAQALELLKQMLENNRIVTGSFPMMVRIVNIMALVPLLRSRIFCCYRVRIKDSMIPGNNGSYQIELSEDYGRIKTIPQEDADREMNIAKLAELLFEDTTVYLHEWV